MSKLPLVPRIKASFKRLLGQQPATPANNSTLLGDDAMTKNQKSDKNQPQAQENTETAPLSKTKVEDTMTKQIAAVEEKAEVVVEVKAPEQPETVEEKVEAAVEVEAPEQPETVEIKAEAAVEVEAPEQPEEQPETFEAVVSQSEIDSVLAKQPEEQPVVESPAKPKAKAKAKAKAAPKPKAKPKAAPKPQAPVIVQCQPNQQWHASYEAVVGLAHRDANPPLPCQDSAMALNTPRPMVIVADGAGSSAVSEIGSLAITTGLTRLLNTLEKQVAQLLDTNPATNDAGNEAELRNFGLLLVKHAKGILDDLAAQHRRPQKDLRSTLLLAIQGKAQLLWVKIGDGALVTETLTEKEGQLLPSLQTLGKVGKGEFANATTFIDDHLQPSDVQIGSCASELITGFAAMSDGAADRLVANDGGRVSPQISDWFNKLRQDKLKRRELTRLFSSENFTKGTTGDDASIALCASGIKEPTTKAKG